jgi:hypothetical protein
MHAEGVDVRERIVLGVEGAAREWIDAGAWYPPNLRVMAPCITSVSNRAGVE